MTSFEERNIDLRTKVYLSDEGFGHIVRQSAITEELQRLQPDLKLHVQTHKHLEMARKILPAEKYLDVYNNISWHKTKMGEPDHEAIESHYKDYIQRSEKYLEIESLDAYDFVLTDFVYEAFLAAKDRGIPAFGIAHFTWDWFFSKLYPPLIETSLLKYFLNASKQASKLYFPPFSPNEIIRYYGSKAVEVPLIVRRKEGQKKISDSRFKVLIIDSGSAVLKESMMKASKQLGVIDDVLFLSMLEGDLPENVVQIPKGELLADYIPEVDLVIGRAGFNTISECIAYRTPMLLLGEGFNPEMNENIIHIKKSGLGSFMSLEQFESDLPKFLSSFLKAEYPSLNKNMQEHEMATNGAEVIAIDILNSL